MIRVERLTKVFGELVAVCGISLSVEAGEIFAFLGPNGAGKTTTVRMLTTLLRPTAGTIEIDGLDVTRVPNAARQRFGIVFQDPSSDEELTAYENLDLHGALYGVPRLRRRERIARLLEVFDLCERKHHQVKTFSGGMRRRLEIARGLLHTPKVLFLDEPTTGLDPQNRRQLWAQVRAINESEGATIFLTTHYLEEAERIARRVAIIDRGRIIAQGTPGELKRQTATDTLEEAFLALTGSAIRDEEPDSLDRMRDTVRMLGRR